MQNGIHVHFMGVGGIGVSALAGMALHSGFRVSGCDRSANSLTGKMEKAGMTFHLGHSPDHLADADLLVYSSAIDEGHPERAAAGARRISRGGFLAKLMAGRESWGISGTHGKTTTTWLAAHLAIAGALDPMVFVGGIVPDLPEGNYRLGGGPFIAELDESDASFLCPRLDVAIVTNVESEHLSHYRDEKKLFEAFRVFASGVAKSGLLIAGVDNPIARDIFSAHPGRKLSFGFAPGADVAAEGVETGERATEFSLRFRGGDCGRFSLALPGKHNVLNALAALGAALDRGIGVETLRKALAAARGVDRRLERVGEKGGAAIYSDYAHHPTEVAASIGALRQRHAGKILVVFQPHLFSRTRDYCRDFGAALARADAVVITDIYPAREEPIPGVTASLVVDAALAGNADVSGPIPLDGVEEEVLRRAGGYDAVVLMGAGDIDAAARGLV